MSRSIRHSLLSKNEEQLQQLIVDHGTDPTGLAASQVLHDKRAAKISEQLAEVRDLDIKIHSGIRDLKKPHWTVLPNFWLTFLAAALAFVAAILSWLALQK